MLNNYLAYYAGYYGPKPDCIKPNVDGVITLSTSPVSTTLVNSTNPNIPIPDNSIYNPLAFPQFGTVTVITGFPGIPTVNLGNIGSSPNGTFTIPISGIYMITASANFTNVSSTIPTTTPTITMYIYRINLTNLITQIGTIMQNATVISSTIINVSNTITAELCAGDKIFFAVNTTTSSYTVGTDSRFVITCIAKT